MRSKRGVVEIQFNWIFILIAGAIILTLFAGIILRQKNISERSTNVLILNSLDAILAGSEVSEGTVNVVKIPTSKIEFGCNSYTIGTASKQLNTMNVFTPSVLEGNSLISMSLEWSVPYRVTNFIYLTNPRIRYVFVADNSDTLSKKIFDIMPEDIRDDQIHNKVVDIMNEDDDEVRIIFFNRPEEFPDSLIGEKVTALKVDEISGTLEFFEAENNNFVNKGMSYYIEDSTLIGAIFTDDFEIYECTMKNAFEKLNIVSQVYQGKILGLQGTCAGTYSNDHIQPIIDASGTFDSTNTGVKVTLNNAADTLEIKNKEAKEKSCSLIY